MGRYNLWNRTTARKREIVRKAISLIYRRKERSHLKEGNICGDKISLKIRRETTITFLHTRITQKDTFQRFSIQLIFPWSKVMNKTSATKYTKMERIK